MDDCTCVNRVFVSCMFNIYLKPIEQIWKIQLQIDKLKKDTANFDSVEFALHNMPKNVNMHKSIPKKNHCRQLTVGLKQ